MGAIVLLCLTAATLLTGVYLVSQNTRFFVLGCDLALLALASNVVEFLTASPYFSIARRIGEILFLGLIISVILWHIVSDREVTSEILHGAVCVYLLSGLLWTSLYLLLEGLDPGSFYVGSGQNPDQTLDRYDFIFFSFVTLTTLGYGDITPVTSPGGTN